MLPISWISALSVLLCMSFDSADLYRHYRHVSAGNQAGLCRYGKTLECCYGWKKNSKGHCEAQCEQGCKHGECVGHNKCKCFPGYTGKACNQDLNECGLKPRPCQHRCMNTHGSYKCYCLNGYALTPDGSCTNSRTCAQAHCQYGCEEVQGEIRCICPSAGLQLGPDGRTCIDLDECASGKNLCPYNRRCVNTFGSYFCKCRAGYDLKYVNGRYDCEVVVLADVNECVTGIHKCSHNADCLNTHGSYKCKCRPGFRGSGFECSVKPFYQSSQDGDKGGTDEIRNAIPNPALKSPRILGGSKQDRELIKNLILEPVATPSTRMQPFDYEGEVYVGDPLVEENQEGLSEEEEEEDDSQENQIAKEKQNRRGDVFVIREEFQSVLGPGTEVKEIPVQDEFIMDCSFDQGVCEWVQDREDDFDWSAAYHNNGKEYYVAVSGLRGKRKDLARLNLLLSDRTQKGGFCLTFNYRLEGRQVGLLRVLLDNTGYPVWEQSRSQNQDWQTELLTVAWEQEPPKLIIFEAERGKGPGGEIGLDNVVLTSGPCQDDKSVIF
ncbi:epidermal growth factor-like protein 6 isoform X1 [Conger conger]|uniref:epidermal growth factor-like protein 6 isoform X1 n=1 Tax=Conger conger TaxID=82655 RepID=UPI002A5A38A4|nr:epidermal growth factor-like protein 6 isoform X1 [Conger conger]XP_061091228.1 epidermal growth factor-like protein 6 isoform X1 [Conger conger]